MTAPTLPAHDPDQGTIQIPPIVNPYLQIWWANQTVSGVPENVMGWLVAQGWEVTAVVPDTTTTPPTPYYSLAREGMQPKQVLLQLCNSYTVAANDARWANEFRYNQVLENWTELIEATETQMATQVSTHNTDLGVYIADIDTYMDTIDTLIASTHTDLDTDYTTHQTTTRALLTNLGTAEVARINADFAATLAEQLQDLTDRGMYTSILVSDVTARNIKDRDERLQNHYDSLARENLGNEHQLWAERVQLAEQINKAIAQQLNTAVQRIEGWKHLADKNRELIAYQLDERNKLIIGLYGFVERREDIAPEWKDMASMIAGLGDAAGGWIQP